MTVSPVPRICDRRFYKAIFSEVNIGTPIECSAIFFLIYRNEPQIFP